MSIFLIRLKFWCFCSVPSHGRQVALALRELSEIVSFLKLEHAKKFEKIRSQAENVRIVQERRNLKQIFLYVFGGSIKLKFDHRPMTAATEKT